MAKRNQTSPIFISYRRGDAAFATTAINKHLRQSFGDDAVFVDVDSIPLGADFKEHLEQQVAKCDIMLVIIGDEWLCDRLSEPQDYVRLEIEAALQRDIPVIPLLLGDATMPPPDALPESLRKLAFRQGTVIRPGPDFDTDVERLVKVLGEVQHWPRGGDEAVANSVAQAVGGGSRPDRAGSVQRVEATRADSRPRRTGTAGMLLWLVVIAGATAVAVIVLRTVTDPGRKEADYGVATEREYLSGSEAEQRAREDAAQRRWEEQQAAQRAEAERAAMEEQRWRLEELQQAERQAEAERMAREEEARLIREEQQAERRAEAERMLREEEERRLWEEQQAERRALEERLQPR